MKNNNHVILFPQEFSLLRESVSLEIRNTFDLISHNCHVCWSSASSFEHKYFVDSFKLV